MNKKPRLRYGVIGAGSMGRHHARIIDLMPSVSLEAIAEPDKNQHLNIPDVLRSKIYDNYHEILDRVDAISVVSPTSTHYSIAKDCLLANKHLLIEKPFTETIAEAEELISLAKERNLVVAIGYVERFNPAFIELTKIIKKEKILGITFNRLSPFPARITDANVVRDMMIHDLDLLLALLPNEEIAEIKASGKKIKSNKLDRVSATMHFVSGIVAKLVADRVSPERKRNIVVTTERNMYEADLMKKKLFVRDFQSHVPSVHSAKDQDQLTAELTDFIKAIKNNGQPKVTALEGQQTLRLAEEVEKLCC
ncbi:MAG: Gfo/Idh/MocA family oxidoreductase [bacterium]